jgi:spoIIIJ-associated protein
VQSELPPPELVEQACGVLRDILGQMGIEAPVSSSVRDDEVVINLEDPTDGTGGLLVGRKGETLDAFEYLLNRMITRGDENEAHLLIDASGYRERRQQNLESLALRLGEQAKRRRKTVTLSPLNPRDRRIVHLTLEGDPLVNTQSMGRGFLRRLSIVPEGASRRERGRDRSAA